MQGLVVGLAVKRQQISVIVPTLNEAACIGKTLASLQPLRQRGHEVIVVDGGSEDMTVSVSRLLADQVLVSSRGRARQMRAGASAAVGSIFWFLHADSQLPGDADECITQALNPQGSGWGRFDVQFPNAGLLLEVVAMSMNIRSRLTGIATGDQGIFLTRALYAEVGGFPDQALMEDIALSQLLKRCSRPVCLHQKLKPSARRWKQQGVLRTIVLMWSLRLAYFLGVRPAILARHYQR